MNQHKEFRDNYAGAHLSAGNYFVGMLIGLMYHDFKKRNLDIRNNKCMIFTWYVYPLVGYCIVLSSYLFYAYDFPKPSLWMSLYSVITKNMWGAFGAILMFGFVGKLGCKYLFIQKRRYKVVVLGKNDQLERTSNRDPVTSLLCLVG